MIRRSLFWLYHYHPAASTKSLSLSLSGFYSAVSSAMTDSGSSNIASLQQQ
jgi:hypothetical protein